jgi:hypothetical protein
MPARTLAYFWGATIATVCFLGAAWAAWQARTEGPAALAVLVIAAIGVTGGAFVAGRIVVVVGRLQREERAGGDRAHGDARRRSSA